MRSTDKPLIGLTLDHEEPGGYSKQPWYAIRENYCTAITRAGGVPLPLPHELALVEDYLSLLDGVVVTGGHFDLHPSLYGAEDVHETVKTKTGRTDFEITLVKEALAANKPILGICGGQQLLNVALGGTLIQHIPDAIPGALVHEQPNPRTEAGHVVRIHEKTLLKRIVGESEIPVNSAHHQAVEKLGSDVVVNAVAPDGVIEGIEYAKHPFCVGVQWHPEYSISPADIRIFGAFVAAARNAA